MKPRAIKITPETDEDLGPASIGDKERRTQDPDHYLTESNDPLSLVSCGGAAYDISLPSRLREHRCQIQHGIDYYRQYPEVDATNNCDLGKMTCDTVTGGKRRLPL